MNTVGKIIILLALGVFVTEFPSSDAGTGNIIAVAPPKLEIPINYNAFTTFAHPSSYDVHGTMHDCYNKLKAQALNSKPRSPFKLLVNHDIIEVMALDLIKSSLTLLLDVFCKLGINNKHITTISQEFSTFVDQQCTEIDKLSDLGVFVDNRRLELYAKKLLYALAFTQRLLKMFEEMRYNGNLSAHEENFPIALP